MKNKSKFLILIFVIINVLVSYGQQNDTLEIYRDDNGNVYFASFKFNANQPIHNDTLFLKRILNANKEDEFQIVKEFGDDLGFKHKRFQQYYKGLKVENSEYLVHSKNGIIEYINGDFQNIKIPSIEPVIDEKEALIKVLDLVNSKKYKWEDEKYENSIKQKTNNPKATYYPRGELVIAKDYFKSYSNFILAWKFKISSLIPYDTRIIYLDAISGEIVGINPMIKYENTTGTAQTKYSGTKTIICDSYASGYRLNETRNTTSGNSVNIHVRNCQSGYDIDNAIEFDNSNTNWTSTYWPDFSEDQVALDAHWGLEKVSDYWSQVRLRNSLDNQGLAILGYAHYNDTRYPLIWPNNAAWNFADTVLCFGDGDGSNFNPLTALDITGHEYGHGVNFFTANIGSPSYPLTQQCDAIAEGFCDIWGISAEYWAAPTKQTWRIGEEVVKTPYNCIRDIQNPNSTLAKELPHPDTYLGNYWSYSGNAHTNSTVLSHWFYLLSQGGSGTNDNSDSFTVYGLGINIASSIVEKPDKLVLRQIWGCFNLIETKSLSFAIAQSWPFHTFAA